MTEDTQPMAETAHGDDASDTPASTTSTSAPDAGGSPAEDAGSAATGGARRGSTGRARPAQGSGMSAGAVLARVRTVLATAVFTVAVLAALTLALGAALIALDANQLNPIVSAVLDIARQLEGPFADIFTFDSETTRVLVNWSIAAVVFLAIGRLVERVIRP